VEVTTYPTTEVNWATSDIADTTNVRVDKIIISNDADKEHTVSVYENGNSTSTVTKRLTVDLNDAAGITEIDWPYYNPMRIANFIIRTSTCNVIGSTTTGVTAYILVR
jgi:hypothetical protein